MKTIFFIFLMLISGVVIGQGVPKEYGKANTMIIESDLADELLLNDIAMKLMDSNFDIEEINEKLGYLKTSPKTIGALKWEMRVKVRGNEAEFQHYTEMEITIYGVTSGGYDLSNFRELKGKYKEATESMYAFVQSINPVVKFEQK